MISFREAQKIVLDAADLLPTTNVALEECAGLVLAQDLIAPEDLPGFTNAAMDGYALCSRATLLATPEQPVCLKIKASLKAGDNPTGINLGLAETIAIMTGAALPADGPGQFLADAVVRQEDVVAGNSMESGHSDEIVIKGPVKAGENIRFRGEEIGKGEISLKQGTILSSAAIGLLAALGIRNVPVIRKPNVAVLTTGNELFTESLKTDLPGTPPKGKVRDSNRWLLRAALLENKITDARQSWVGDSKDEFQRALEDLLRDADILIITGGVSVGKYDLTRSVLREMGIKPVFWRVAQKPGKPLLFSVREKKLIFGLPGNPGAVLTCFYEYVRPALLKMMGYRSFLLPECSGRLEQSYKKAPELTCFLRGCIAPEGKRVSLLAQQGSHTLRSFTEANCLVVLPEKESEFPEGSAVLVHLLPV